MREITYTVYEIDEHTNKEKCYEWMRNNLHYLSDHELDSFILSLKVLSKEVGGDLDYCVSLTPDRGEYIRFIDYDEEVLAELDKHSCPLTGCFWDIHVIEALLNKDMNRLMHDLHNAHDSHYTDEALHETASVNEWEFTENGERV
jgi:hypothetical protein